MSSGLWIPFNVLIVPSASIRLHKRLIWRIRSIAKLHDCLSQGINEMILWTIVLEKMLDSTTTDSAIRNKLRDMKILFFCGEGQIIALEYSYYTCFDCIRRKRYYNAYKSSLCSRCRCSFVILILLLII